MGSLFEEGRPTMPPGFWQDLADSNPHGLKCPASAAEQWFFSVWPEMRERGYRRHRQTICAWWRRAGRWEIERAIEVVSTRKNDEDNARLEVLAKESEARNEESMAARGSDSTISAKIAARMLRS